MVRKQISDAELEIMKIIWNAQKPLLFAQIMEALARSGNNWQKNTLITLLSRLMQKGYLTAKKQGRKNEYTACISEQEFQSDQTRHFVDRIYEGRVSGLIARLVQSDRLSEEEYAQLRKILEER